MAPSSPPQAPAPMSLVKDVSPIIGSRALFPGLGARAYLAHAAISPASLLVSAAVSACTKTVAELGVGSFPIYMAQRERLRTAAAKMLGVAADHLALNGGCTRGITDLALSLPWKKDETLLSYKGEFPANVIPWRLAARAHGAHVELSELPAPNDPDCQAKIVETLDQRLAARGVPYVAVSAVQFQTGLRMPIGAMAEVCRKHGARLFVDGIQAAGVVPLDLRELGVDAFFVGAHKWMLAVEGAGFGYFSPDLMATLNPQTAGWLSFPEAEYFLFRGAGHLRYDRELLSGPQVFEGSTSNTVGFAALEAGVDLLSTLTQKAIFDHVQSYHDAIEQPLVELGLRSLRPSEPGLRSGILSFVPPDDVEVPTLAARLREQGIVISTPDGLIRLAPHFSNSLDEVDAVVAGFREALSP